MNGTDFKYNSDKIKGNLDEFHLKVLFEEKECELEVYAKPDRESEEIIAELQGKIESMEQEISEKDE